MGKNLESAQRLRNMGMISKEAYDSMETTYNKILEICNPEEIKKTAALSWESAAIPLGMLGTFGGVMAAQNLMNTFRLSRSKDRMYKVAPELKEIPKTQVDQAWEVLKSFAPSVAANPITAANFIKGMAQMPTVGDPATVKALIDIESGHQTPGSEGASFAKKSLVESSLRHLAGMGGGK